MKNVLGSLLLTITIVLILKINKLITIVNYVKTIWYNLWVKKILKHEFTFF